MKILVVILQGLLTAAFLIAGGAKLASALAMVQSFDKLGFGQWFRYLTACLEILGAVGLWIPRASVFAALLLFCVMVGAVAAHRLVLGGDPTPALILLAMSGCVVWLRRTELQAAFAKNQ